MKKILEYLNETRKKEKALLVFTVIIFIAGVVLGSLFINLITKDDKILLINQVQSYIDNIKKLSDSVFGIKYLRSEILNNIIQLFMIFSLGISMIGIPAVIIILFFKGFTLGTTLSSIILKYKIKGILGCFLYVFPVMIINIVIYVFFSFFAVSAAIKFLKALFRKSSLDFKNFFGRYILLFLISVLLISLTCVLDSYLTPLLLKLFTFII